MSITIYNTSDIKPSNQFEYWNDWVCDVFIGLTCNKHIQGAGFRGELRTLDLEKIDVSEVRCDSLNVQHTQHHVSVDDQDVLMVHLQLAGESVNTQAKYESHLKPGDLALCRSSIPYTLSFDQPTRLLVIKIPVSLVQSKISKPGLLAGLKIDGSNAISQILVSHLQEIWKQRDSLNETSCKIAMADGVISLLTTAVQIQYPEKFRISEHSLGESQLTRLKLFIDKNITNSDLSPSCIATANGISNRYMRMLFQKEGITCGKYLLRSRLNAVANELRSTPNRQEHSISQLAYKWGFNNMSHFSSVFKDSFELSPSQYKQKYLEAQRLKIE